MGKIVLRLDAMMVERKISTQQTCRVGGHFKCKSFKNNKATAICFTTLAAICEALECEAGDLLEYQKE